MVVAFAILPVVQATVAFVGFSLWLSGGSGFADPFETALGFAVLIGLAGALTTVAGAVPVVWWLRRRGPVSLSQLLWAGGLLGNAPFATCVIVFIVPATISHLAMGTMSQHLLPVSDLLAGTLRLTLAGSALGLVSAWVFWRVADLEG